MEKQYYLAIDIGASTGGFTHCLLIYGADKVYAIDSGTNQLDEMLLDDERVISIENYNARNICVEDIGELADIITVDVSFISQTYILYPAVRLLKDDGIYIEKALKSKNLRITWDKIAAISMSKEVKDGMELKLHDGKYVTFSVYNSYKIKQITEFIANYINDKKMNNANMYA